MENQNDVLLALKLCEVAYSRIKDGKRDQLARGDLSIMKQAIAGAMQKLPNDFDMYVLLPLSAIAECLNRLIADDCEVVDNETKNRLADELVKLLDTMYVSAGKYYTTHEFEYNSKMEVTLRSLVDNCVDKGYYFGMD